MITFNSKDEILASSIVTTYVDNLKAESDQKVLELKAKVEELEKKLKTDIVDKLVANSIELKLSKVKPALESKDETAKKACIDSYRNELLGKSTETLESLLSVTSEQIDMVRSQKVDPMTQKLANQVDSQIATPPASTPAVGKEVKPASAPASTPATVENQDSAVKPPSEKIDNPSQTPSTTKPVETSIWDKITTPQKN